MYKHQPPIRDDRAADAAGSGEDSQGERRLAGGYGRALAAADVFFGGFVILNLALAVIGWWRGDAPVRDVFAIGAFLVVNVALSEMSRRSRRARQLELVRLAVGGILTPTVYVVVSGPLAPWWPAFMVLSLGGAIGFGLLTQRPRAGRLVVLYYVSLFAVGVVVRGDDISAYQLVLWGGVIAMAGLMFAEVMSLLGQVMRQEHERSLEVKAARDALFAEVEVAQGIQTLLLPHAPEVAGHAVHGTMVTASEVGGDYYDVIESTGGRTLLAIGDVAGHGVTAGLTMMMARTSLLGAIEAAPAASLAELYRVLNRCLRKNLARMDLGLYMTFGLLEHVGGGRFHAVGRHLPFLIYRHATRAVDSVELDGMWLGVIDELEPNHLRQIAIDLAPGDLMLLYTDGVIEQFAGDEMFGFERLCEVVRTEAAGGPAHLVTRILDALGRFSSAREDDVTMLAVSCTTAAEHGTHPKRDPRDPAQTPGVGAARAAADQLEAPHD